MKKLTNSILAFLFLFGLILPPTTPVPAGRQGTPAQVLAEMDQAWLARAEAAESFTIQLQEPSLVVYLSSNAPSAPQGTGDSPKIALQSPQAALYLKHLNDGIDAFLAEAEKLLGRELAEIHRYTYVINGFSASLSVEEAAILRQHPSVREVFADTLMQRTSDTSHTFIGADQVWNGNAVPLQGGKRGEGVRVAIIDTGINMSHPSFTGSTPDYTFPAPPGGFLGLCQTHPARHPCNNKLIGVYDMLNNISGHDTIDHGSSVAGIIAGNPIDATYNGITVPISGIAPRAQILSYKVCDISGCPPAQILAGINQAIADQADVLSLAFAPQSGPPRDPWQDAIHRALLEATISGVVTVASAGNFGPAEEKIYTAAPWTLVAGNTQHGRIFGYSIYAQGYGMIIDTVAYPASPDLAPALLATITQATLLKDATNNLYGCNAWTNPASLRVALVMRGVCDFRTKLQNFKDAGGWFLLVYNDKPGAPPIEMGSTTGSVSLPAAMLSYETGNRLMTYGMTAKVTIEKDLIGGYEPGWGDILAESSARGPISNLDILKPDLVAPGQNILAAYAAPGQTDLMSGSTMSAAQVAGAAAVLRSLYPGWSPSAIQSALVMTALANTTRDYDGMGVTPFDYGNGRVDLSKAALAGLVMEENPKNFTQANPAQGGDPRKLNIPSYQNSICLGSCSFTRTLRNVTSVATTYAIGVEKWNAIQVTTSPSGTFQIPPGGTQQVTVTVSPALDAGANWQFARIVFQTSNTFPDGKEISDVAFPLAVKTKTSGSNLPADVRAFTHQATNQLVLDNVQFTGPVTIFTSTVYGLSPATIYDFQLAKDPVNNNPYDDLSQIWYTSITCPANQQRMVVEVLETSALDLDIYIGTGSTPQQASEQVRVAAVGALEYLNIPNPAFSGTCWIMVQSYASSAAGVSDPVRLAIGFVPRRSEGSITVTGPRALPALQPFQVAVDYTLSRFAEKTTRAWYGYLLAGSSPGTPGDMGEVNLNIYKTETAPPHPPLGRGLFLPLIAR